MPDTRTIAIVGGGPAGLMAADVLSRAPAGPTPIQVLVYDAMPSPGRKFLMAGKGGMNITHAEAFDTFCTRYGARAGHLTPLLRRFGPDALRAWLDDLGIETFIGSSGRVFPVGMQAAPLLRAWLHRLRQAGVRLQMRHRWDGLERQEDGAYRLRFTTPDGERYPRADAVILALGGGSWAKLGSDGRWVNQLAAIGVPIAPLRPANCGFDVGWSEHLRIRFAGQPVKSVVATVPTDQGPLSRKGEFMMTHNGIEGGLIYALSAALRDTLEQAGHATLTLDLLPDHDLQRVIDALAHPRGARSLSSHLQSRLGLKGVKVALLHECLDRETLADPGKLACAIKALPLHLKAPRPLDEAISSAGGVLFDALDEHLMLRQYPGVFCAGEMLDWEAPTGGYLLTGCLSSGYAAGQAALARCQPPAADPFPEKT